MKFLKFLIFCRKLLKTSYRVPNLIQEKYKDDIKVPHKDFWTWKEKYFVYRAGCKTKTLSHVTANPPA
ncbi:MAG: hypothetical protein BGP13_23900 [Sphingobacteriales bacterium 40-81]|nr:MAG: hypothetical protein BGP13_23900 [Sphingobacteriales bacterium 40-81]